MPEQPKIHIKLTATDTFIEILGWVAILGIWLLTLLNYAALPETIPVHYNGAGEADGFGSKGHILMLPLISMLLFIGLTILNRFPHILNYPTSIRQENALWQYTNATRMFRFLKLVITLLFGLIVFKTQQNAHDHTEGLGAWFLPLTFGLIFVPIIYYLTKMNTSKKNKNTGYNNV
uniref:DUF1648 domain-containing protein n=1 Tax=Roseihalotalea indica TaxID=2867963 RepID=A0AA49GHF3_9BACT|nr:DUF1648 domain-containing protein [Tunicatimonas sp. TK19036]